MPTFKVQPTILTLEKYGKKVTVQFEDSMTEISELFKAFETCLIGHDFIEENISSFIKERAAEINYYEDLKNDQEDDVDSSDEESVVGFSWEDVDLEDDEQVSEEIEDEDLDNGNDNTEQENEWDYSDSVSSIPKLKLSSKKKKTKSRK